ncbi:dienelactone hydrolase family protein [Aquabacterium humicola]|uniref:dienelactone hydrolase family protein n=1 Tax=Aquabacterium humicola TaxID=3237377 RepID=UPI002543EDFE|nr:dienelactone hydrolase family protein [Rubrivivax pictus]
MRAALCALGLLAALIGPPAVAEPQDVEVSSLDRRGDAPLKLRGFWFAREGETKPAPALVLLHGCGGPYDRRGRLSQRMQDYAALLNREGWHVLVIDSLGARGETELCTQRTGERAVTMTQRRRDALGALQWLAARPDVDGARLGLIGWSNGGSTVLAALQRGHREVDAAAVRPAFGVAFYPGCIDPQRRGWQPVAPLLMLLGGADDWTPSAPCEALAARVGAAVQHETYPGAYHGFDGDAPVRLRRDVPNGVNPGQGVHVGGDPAAREASRERLLRFLRERVAASR